jgi:hypothetical protein
VVLKPASQKAVHAFLDALDLFGLGFSWGGYESLAIHCDPQLKNRAVPVKLEGPLLRLHVGLESDRPTSSPTWSAASRRWPGRKSIRDGAAARV